MKIIVVNTNNWLQPNTAIKTKNTKSKTSRNRFDSKIIIQWNWVCISAKINICIGLLVILFI